MAIMVLVLGGSSLWAQNNFGTIKNVHGYLGFGVGLPDMQSGIDTPVGGTQIDRSVFSYRMFGGVMLTDWLAFEGHYADMGTDTATASQITDAVNYLNTQYNFDQLGKMEAKSHSYGVAPVISINLPYVRPFVKFGYHWWKYQFKASGLIGGTTSSFSRNSTGGDMFWGLGLDFKLFPRIWMRLQFESLPIDQRRPSLTSINLMGLF